MKNYTFNHPGCSLALSDLDKDTTAPTNNNTVNTVIVINIAFVSSE